MPITAIDWPRRELDPDCPRDWWYTMPIVFVGGFDAAMRCYYRLTRLMVRFLPWRVRYHLRVDFQLHTRETAPRTHPLPLSEPVRGRPWATGWL